MFRKKIKHSFLALSLLVVGVPLLRKAPPTSFNTIEEAVIHNALAAHIDIIDESSIPRLTEKKKETWLTVFVHGIMSIKPHINAQTFFELLNDKVKNTFYSKTIEYMRLDPHFYKNQAMQAEGLHKINVRDIQPGNASAAMATAFNEIDMRTNGREPSHNHYYTFGWSGLMSASRRYTDAIDFYKKLDAEVQKFRARGINPKLRVIGYSHGGNICLNLARVRQERNDINKDFRVSELVLIGSPVQEETDYLITDPLFEKVYNIFSYADRVQPLDVFSPSHTFSMRTFKSNKRVQLPNKLVQIRLKITRLTEQAQNNLKKRTLAHNLMNPAILSGRSHLLKNSSPGHAELWFFGWTAENYRENFPLNPLPSATLIPLLIKAAESLDGKINPQRPITLDVRPEHGFILVKNRHNPKVRKLVGAIPVSELEKIKKKVLQFAPKSYTPEEYNQQIDSAVTKAELFYKNYKINKEEEAKDRRTLRKKTLQRARRQHKTTQKAVGVIQPRSLISTSTVPHIKTTIS